VWKGGRDALVLRMMGWEREGSWGIEGNRG